MVVREGGEVKGIQGIAVQEDGTTQVSITDTLNIVGGGTVTDVGGVATINIPYGVTWIREDVPAGSATYTFVNSPATSSSFLVFTDSGTLLFLGVDYTYDPSTETITFLSLGNNEAAYIWNAHASVSGGGIGDMVKAVYDPTNINSSAFNMDNFIDGTNKHYISTSEKTAISTALQPNDNISELVNDAGYITSASLPTKTSDLQNDSGFITGINSGDVTTALGYTPYDSSNPNGYITSSALSGYQTTANLKTDLTDDSDTYYPSQKAVKTAVDAKQDALSSQTVYTSKGTSTAVPTITTNSLGQVTTISETNIAFPVTSVNGQTGDVTVSGGGQKTFDAIVAADGTGDYTSVKAALDATKSRIFVKNGTYNHQDEYWDAGNTNLNDVYIEGESTKGVIINFSSTTGITSSNRAFIHTSTGSASSAHSFVLKNMTINVAADGGNAGSTGPYNALFKDNSSTVSVDRLWRVENCVFNFDTTSGGACLTYGFSTGTLYTTYVTQYPKLKSGFFGCEIHFESSCYYNFALSTQPYNLDAKAIAFDRCMIKNNTSIVTGLQSCIFYGCDINVSDAGISGIKLYDTGLQCDNVYRGFTADTVGGQDSTYYSITTLYNSKLSASTTVQPCDYIRLGETTNSSVYFGCGTNKIVIRTDGVWSNSYIRCDENNSQVSIRHKVTGCNIECDRIDIDTDEQITGTELGSSTSGVHTMLLGTVTGCGLVGNWTISGDDNYSYNGATVTGCKCKGTGQEITLDGDSCVFSGNVQFNLKLILGANANRCVVTGNYINSFETLSGSSYCVITGNAFGLSLHSQGTGHVYANNYD